MKMDEEDLSRMNAVLRHRLRNFASGIKTAISLLSAEADGLMPPQFMEYFPLITNECNRLDLMTRRLNLLFDTAPDGGRGTVRSVLEKWLREFHMEFPTAHISVDSSEEALDLLIPATKAVRIALRETVENAIVADKKKEVTIDCGLHRDFLRFRIVDQGPGVSPEDCEKIFQPFYTTRSRHIGIGLTIARRLIGGIGGTTAARKNSRGGLTVDLAVPRGTVDS